MKWNPDKNHEGSSVLPGHKYAVAVEDATECETRNGDPMIKLKLIMTVGKRQFTQWMNITPAYMPGLKAFAMVANLESEFEAGTINEKHCMGKRFGIVMGTAKTERGYYEPESFCKLSEVDQS